MMTAEPSKSPALRSGAIRPDLLSVIVVAAYTILWCARWPAFPIFIDVAYHLSIAKQMLLAGGWFSWEAWEFAPVGRPHLYPPVLHFMLAGLLGLGGSPELVMKLATALVIPALIGSIGAVTRRLFGEEEALAAVLMAGVSFAAWIQIGGAIASGIALIELLWLMVAWAEGRAFAAACLTGLLFYTHLGMPLVALVTLFAALVCRAVSWRWVLKPWLLGAGLLILPWLLHVIPHLGELRVQPRFENASVEFFPLQIFLGLIGIVVAFSRSGKWRLSVALLIGALPLAAQFPARLLQGEGVVAWIFLAAFGIQSISSAAQRHTPGLPRWIWIILISSAVLVSPSLQLEAGNLRVLWPDTAPFHLLDLAPEPKGSDLQVYSKDMEALSGQLAQVSPPQAILWSNAAYAGGLAGALANRPMASAMFYEVGPGQPFDPFLASWGLIWFKIADLPDAPPLQGLIDKYGLSVVADGPLAVIFKTSSGGLLAERPKAVVPWRLAGMVLCLAIGMAGWDLRRGRRRAPA